MRKETQKVHSMKDFLMGSDEFTDYVLSFYSKGWRGRKLGIYPFNCDDATIRAAVYLVVEAGMKNETFAADTADREKVRAVLETLGYKETT
jgi:hypothetical protein